MADTNDVFGSDDSDNEQQPSSSSSSSSSQIVSQTQPEVSKMVSDIFGDSDDDDDDDNGNVNGAGDGDKWDRIKTTFASTVLKNVNSDDIFASDSEDEETATNSAPIKQLRSLDSDTDDDMSPTKATSLKKKKKKDKEGKSEKKKRKREERESKKAKKREKRLKKKQKEGSSSATIKKDGSGYDSGDSYDSGGEVERNADDDKFIDRTGDDDSDLEGYGGPQNFKDSRPDKKKQRKKELDPVSETIEYMKKKKALVMTDTQKNQLSVDLRTKMLDAAKQDEELASSDQPAIAKINFLSTVQRVLGLKTIQNQLLDNHILDALNLWIEPKGEYLTSLTVRAAIYEILKGLPCQIDHLRGSQIGKTILALKKHKKEIPENKRILKEIMEKWCRPIFSLSSDARGQVNAAKPELAHILKNRIIQKNSNAMNNDKTENQDFSFEEQVAGKIRKKEDGVERVRAIVSNGHMFTVRPTTSADFDDKKVSGNVQSVTSQKMKSKLKDLKSMIRKDPHAAMDVVLNGRDKS